MQKSRCDRSKSNVGRGTRGAVAWLEWALRNKTLEPGDVLLTDNEKCWKTDEFTSMCSDGHIMQMFFPADLGHLMNPCDNSFHATFKLKMQQHLINYPLATRKDKLRCIERAYYDCHEHDVQALFAHCGITDNRPARTMSRLITEGIRPREKFLKVHSDQLDAYKKWTAVTEWCDPQDDHPEQLASLSMGFSKRLLARISH
ncbi:MAG: hypothetical protein H0W28_12805 [Pyrinomonadaceae bacterium]|nr:hypothetical protein [Pyrinomonadaceae bacterium]